MYSKSGPASDEEEAASLTSRRDPGEIAISPVRIISMSPNGRTMFSNAAILSVVPVTSTISERFVTSTTFAAEDLGDLHDLGALRRRR